MFTTEGALQRFLKDDQKDEKSERERAWSIKHYSSKKEKRASVISRFDAVMITVIKVEYEKDRNVTSCIGGKMKSAISILC